MNNIRTLKLPLGTLGKYQSNKYYCEEYPEGILAKEYGKLKWREGDYKQKHYKFAENRTITGAITQMFYHQAGSSKQRNHQPPNYSRLELFDWIMTQPNVTDLFYHWIEKGHKKDDKPSCDRIDDTTGYSLENLSLKTWGANNAKGHLDQKSGKLRASVALTPVIMFTPQGEQEMDFISLAQAVHYLRENGYPKAAQSAICNCCKGKLKSAYKHKWEYKTT